MLALFLAYGLQTLLSTSGTLRRSSEHFSLREFGCLESVSEPDFDLCLKRFDVYIYRFEECVIKCDSLKIDCMRFFNSTDFRSFSASLVQIFY